MIEQFANRLKSILARGILHLVQELDGRQFCQVTVLNGEVKNSVERIQRFGFASMPPSGSAALIGFIGADRGKPIILGENNPSHHFSTLQSGESALFDALDQYIHLKTDGSIEIKTNGTLLIKSADKVRMETDQLEVTGEIIDRVDLDGTKMSRMREIYDDHDHDENDNNTRTEEPNQLMGGGI